MGEYLLKPMLIFVLIVINFVMQSTTVEVADRKGYNKKIAGLIGLIPFIGLGIYLLKKPMKNSKKVNYRKTFNIKEILLKFFIYCELLFVAVIVFIPIIYIIGASLSPTDSLPTTLWPKNASGVNFTTLLWGEKDGAPIYVKGDFVANFKSIFFGPNLQPSVKNFFQIVHRSKFIKWYFNTLGIAVINMIVGVIFITGAAYVFARFKFKGKKAGLVTILVLQVFPSFMGLVAMFVLFETFNLLGKPLALSILYIGGSIPYNMWIIKGYLMNIPKELDESAMIDGANKLQIFFKIILPLSVPILSFVAVSMFMAPWMDYMLPSFLLSVDTSTKSQIDTWTLAVGLFDMISGTNNQFTSFAAGAVIVALPITILYIAFQRYLVEGITAGSTKG